MGKESPQPTDTSLSIGRSSYLLSAEAQKHLELDDVFKLDSPNPVLVVQEPHFSLEGQINLFRGLEIFFQDNPDLVGKTIFLAEGYPAGQIVSVQPLIDVEPNPSDQLIQEVLGTYLITGYMAYEWKHQRNIPIVGTENKQFYDLSRDLAVASQKSKDNIFTKVGFKDGSSLDVTFDHASTFSFVLRNKSMFDVLIEQQEDFENPILFVGFAHLHSLNPTEFEFMKDLAEGGLSNPFGPHGIHIKTEAENGGIINRLATDDIGFHLLDPVGMKKLNKNIGDNTYDLLFSTQQQGEWTRRSRDEYKNYLRRLLSQSPTGKAVTTKPSPEAAAQYVKALKGGEIFESKSTTKKGGWFQVSAENVRKKLGKDSMWDKGITPRGGNFEKLAEANLGSNCRVIDHFNAEARSVTSLKSLDLRSQYYQDPPRIDYVVSGYIEELSEFWGVRWTAPRKAFKIFIKRGIHFEDRYLDLAIPLGGATQAQRQKLQELQEYAASVDVILNIIEVP